VSAHFLAIDLGAESGRAILGRLHDGRLDVSEIHRFPNEPVRQHGALQWDILRLWLEIRRGLERAAPSRIESIGVDTWGCDYALIGERGTLLQNPYHYRDARTDGIMDAVFARVPPEDIYSVTGIQFLPFNTLFQLYAASKLTPKLLDAAVSFGTIPDVLNYWLTGELCAEFTNATTTQLIDARSRSWATDLMSKLELPTRILPRVVEPGTAIGRVTAEVSAVAAGTVVVAPACHDTGSAFAAVNASGGRAFLSSGTWSLLGIELPAPVITPRARELNFTNEGGVCGTTRLLKNITGLWLLQACRRSWSEAGQSMEYDELLEAARDDRHAFRCLVDPDYPAFLHPPCMVTAIAAFCRDTGQPAPDGPAGYVRAILESLAFKYRAVLDRIEELIGTRIDELRIVGGGARNRLLNQFAADATGRVVTAGPIEATALGNIAMQMVATGAVPSLAAAREIIARSFPVERFEPVGPARWEQHYRRFQGYLELTCV
jgi:rhamnulokinase